MFVVAMWSAKDAPSAHMMRLKAALAILVALSASIALADDFKTIDGKEYKNVKVSRVEPDGIVVDFQNLLHRVAAGKPDKVWLQSGSGCRFSNASLPSRTRQSTGNLGEASRNTSA